ncbi:HU family DNA-binding protein [Embleya sp. MST-111070]|uniref:HU family DNA-binding protein n=1 Tax=Embleya sp. MST-111070 TaxID=3398231 RepID=UPI003F73D6D7
MNKAELVKAVADKIGEADAALAVDAVLDTIVRAVVAGEPVSVTGFGTFEKVARAARYARNPQTGERVRVKKTAVPRFRPGQGFKDLTSRRRKLPRSGPAFKKAARGTLTGTATGTVAPTKKVAAKARPNVKTVSTNIKVPAKKTTATAAPAKRAAAKITGPAMTTGSRARRARTDH